jgi:NADPH:quinone reductase-like Zn-dependent oxidoreductase
VLAPTGVYVTTLPSAGTIVQMILGTIVGGRRARLLNVRSRGADLDVLTGWIEAGTVRPRIERVYPLAKTAEAHAHSETGHVRGKLVISVTD